MRTAAARTAATSSGKTDSFGRRWAERARGESWPVAVCFLLYGFDPSDRKALNSSVMRRTLSKYADLIPLGAFAVVVALVFLFARERSGGIEREQEQAHSAAELRASALADQVSNEVSTRLGALVAARLRFTSIADATSEAAFLAALDSVVNRAAPGLAGIAHIDVQTERIVASPGARLTLEDSAVRNAFV